MIEQIIHIDQNIFLLINGELKNQFFDWIMPALRNKFLWFPLYAVLAGYLVMKFKKRAIIIIIIAGLTVVVGDQLSSSVIKPSFERLRPCNDPVFAESVNLEVNCGPGYSFPSSHATNHFALAVFIISILYRRMKCILIGGLLWAGSIAYSQVYVGVHYPADAAGGALLGSSIGLIFAFIYRKIQKGGK
ncbi:MAG: phosphatase PAP2 family protein [Bacteroidetes bacterium]|nr:phosphatase PAP2 family protein [Bacteroidota bacterium]